MDVNTQKVGGCDETENVADANGDGDGVCDDVGVEALFGVELREEPPLEEDDGDLIFL